MLFRSLEVLARIDLQKGGNVALEFASAGNDAPPLEMSFDGSDLGVMGTKIALSSVGGRQKLSLRVFIDRSVMEVFANETACFTRTIKPLTANATLSMRAEHGTARAELIEAWPMKTIW